MNPPSKEYISPEDARNASIIRQVAFKGAVEIMVAKHELLKEQTAADTVKAVKWLTDEFEKIINNNQSANS